MPEEQARFRNARSDLESDASAGKSSDYTKQATSELIKKAKMSGASEVSRKCSKSDGKA